jgi:hypothetical protein
MYNLDNLTENELLDLKNQITGKIKKIKEAEKEEIDRKNSVKNKTKLSQLTSQDRIFGIRISGNIGHRMVESNEDISTTWKVDIVDYCNVTEYTDKSRRGSEWHRINISHPTESFGLGTSLSDEEVDKYYILAIDISSNGYNQFYTLRPETWETDIIIAFNELLEAKRTYFERDCNKLTEKFNIFIKEKEKIDNFIKNL